MKYFFIAGEKSGDQHAGALAVALKKLDSNADLRAWGGSMLETAGAKVVQRYEEMAFMGLDFLFSLRKIIKLFKCCKEDVLAFKPDVLILVDFGGFNLRIAKWAHSQGIRCHYFIPPKTWAWNESRNKKLSKYIEAAYVILPFEEAYLRSHGVNAFYVGNPTKEFIDGLDKTSSARKGIALLPGSRVGELKRNAPLMLELTKEFEAEQFIVAGLAELPLELYDPFNSQVNVNVIFDQTQQVLQASKAAVVTSGTATLETALNRTPQIVIYKASKMLYWIGKVVVKVKYISLVNLIANKEIVKEFIQKEFSFTQVVHDLKQLISDTKARQNQLIAYEEIDKKLTSKIASKEAAMLIYQNLIKNEN